MLLRSRGRLASEHLLQSHIRVTAHAFESGVAQEDRALSSSADYVAYCAVTGFLGRLGEYGLVTLKVHGKTTLWDFAL